MSSPSGSEILLVQPAISFSFLLKLDMAHLDLLPSPGRAPIWLSPSAPCYGCVSGPLNRKAPWGECESSTQDRCDACLRPVCLVHSRRYWPHREDPPAVMEIAHRRMVDPVTGILYRDPVTWIPYCYARLCYDCKAVDLDWEWLPRRDGFISVYVDPWARQIPRARSRSR